LEKQAGLSTARVDGDDGSSLPGSRSAVEIRDQELALELPDALKVATEDFQEGWSFITSGDTHWMDKKVRSYGWHFIWIAEPTLRSGVAHTAQAAIASGLKLALRRINPGFNAASIDSIEVINIRGS
jgi:hypothetical protein